MSEKEGERDESGCAKEESVRGEWRTKKIMMLEDFRVCDRLLAPFSKLSPMFRPPKQNTRNNNFKIEIITSKKRAAVRGIPWNLSRLTKERFCCNNKKSCKKLQRSQHIIHCDFSLAHLSTHCSLLSNHCDCATVACV